MHLVATLYKECSGRVVGIMPTVLLVCTIAMHATCSAMLAQNQDRNFAMNICCESVMLPFTIQNGIQSSDI